MKGEVSWPAPGNSTAVNKTEVDASASTPVAADRSSTCASSSPSSSTANAVPKSTSALPLPKETPVVPTPTSKREEELRQKGFKRRRGGSVENQAYYKKWGGQHNTQQQWMQKKSRGACQVQMQVETNANILRTN